MKLYVQYENKTLRLNGSIRRLLAVSLSCDINTGKTNQIAQTVIIAGHGHQDTQFDFVYVFGLFSPHISGSSVGVYSAFCCPHIASLYALNTACSLLSLMDSR